MALHYHMCRCQMAPNPRAKVPNNNNIMEPNGPGGGSKVVFCHCHFSEKEGSDMESKPGASRQKEKQDMYMSAFCL